MATFVRPADAYRARHRAPPGDAERALADLSLRDEGVASAPLGGLPDDLWRRICAYGRRRERGGAQVGGSVISDPGPHLRGFAELEALAE